MADEPCLVVGGGVIGFRKATTLIRAGATVTIVAPELSPECRKLLDDRSVVWHEREYTCADLDGMTLVVAATSDRDLNLRIGADARHAGVLCCVVSSARDSQVIFPAIWSDDDTVVAVHTHGRDCAGSRKTRDSIAAYLNK